MGGKPVNEMTKRRRGVCPSHPSLQGERDAGRWEGAGSEKPEAYSLEFVEDVFELRTMQMPAESWSKEKGLPRMDF
jgi:hypothetical protein